MPEDGGREGRGWGRGNGRGSGGRGGGTKGGRRKQSEEGQREKQRDTDCLLCQPAASWPAHASVWQGGMDIPCEDSESEGVEVECGRESTGGAQRQT